MTDKKPVPPDLDQLSRLISAIGRPQGDTQSLGRIFQGMVVVIALAIAFWLVTSVNTMQQTLAVISSTVKSTQDAVRDVQAAQGSATSQIGEIKGENGQLSQRITALESGQQRMNDRMRIVEGQKPLPDNRP